MKKTLPILLFLCLFVFGCFNSVKTQSKDEILGIKIGMSRKDAENRLKEIGKMEREEGQQQSIWSLNNNPAYSHLIIAFGKENQEVRFITAKMRPDGTRVRYSDVLDIAQAQQTKSAKSYKYSQEFPGNFLTYGYAKIASGADAENLTYYSLKELNDSAEDSEEDDDD